MNLLLDSHALLWALHAPHRMRADAVVQIQDTRQPVYFSAASAWELELKASKGKLTLPPDWLRVAESTGFLQTPVTAAVAQISARLPRYHTDPFDRLLVAQALEQGLRIATRDAVFGAYGVDVLEV
ncbi:MAG TPA: type II toxin-antitoxin system VapC family toxin [Gemmatimonadaceae bacterium]|nr:type II toxin-antitoxin system VapC family toxin [Gemmatimonadaceae bacterium]